MRKPGCVEPVIYFVNGNNPNHSPGYIMLAAHSGQPAPPGYHAEEADTLHAIDALEQKLFDQEKRNLEMEGLRDEMLTATRRKEISDNLDAIMKSSGTSEYERDFIREWKKMRADHPKKKYFAESFQCYLWARHNDVGKRRADSEEFNVEKHEVRD